MLLLNACEDGDVLNGVRIALVFINIFKVIVPLILIFIGCKHLFSVVVQNKDGKFQEALKSFAKNIIAGLIVFMIPTLINALFMNLAPDALNYKTCVEGATPEGIQKAYYNTSLKMIEKAKSDLDAGELRDAYSYAKNKIKDSSRLKEIEQKVQKIQKYVDVLSEISIMTRKNQYNPLRDKVNAVDDPDVKAHLLDKLERKFRTLEDKHGPLKRDRSGSSSDGSGSNPAGVASISIDGPIVKQEETETLKVYIHKINSYYITQVWVANPYMQLNKYDSPQYGKSLYRPGDLLARAAIERGLNDKLIVGFNASGFYLKGTYDVASVNYYPAYDRTSVGSLVITDGKVVRNAYNKACKTWYIAGVDKDNVMNIYTDSKTNDFNAKQEWANGVIGSIRNTFTFASPLVINGQASNETTSMPSPGSALNRQAICQIDNNNFILITGSGLTRQNMIDIMLKANCQTGTNFDGGGSIALLYKSKNSTSIETIIGNGRALSEVGYFSE